MTPNVMENEVQIEVRLHRNPKRNVRIPIVTTNQGGATRPPRKPTTSGRSAHAPAVQRCRRTCATERPTADSPGRTGPSAPARISDMDHLLCLPCARILLAERNGRLRTFTHCPPSILKELHLSTPLRFQGKPGEGQRQRKARGRNPVLPNRRVPPRNLPPQSLKIPKRRSKTAESTTETGPNAQSARNTNGATHRTVGTKRKPPTLRRLHLPFYPRPDPMRHPRRATPRVSQTQRHQTNGISWAASHAYAALTNLHRSHPPSVSIIRP